MKIPQQSMRTRQAATSQRAEDVRETVSNCSAMHAVARDASNAPVHLSARYFFSSLARLA